MVEIPLPRIKPIDNKTITFQFRIFIIVQIFFKTARIMKIMPIICFTIRIYTIVIKLFINL